jgi:hypothetical protein
MRVRTTGAVCAAAIGLLAIVAPAGAVSSRTAGGTDTKAWCQAVIDTNTKAGTMKNKRFVSIASVSPSAWKKVVDAAATGGDRFIAIAPSSIKTAVRHQVAYFRHVKANHYSKTTPLAPLTVGEATQITNFEKTQCGITFSG